MQSKNKQHNGFTIVELLIVIVVIGILAAISIVAYSGIQNRAKNQQMVAAVRSYYVAVKSYAVDNGSLPTTNGCLGASASYASNPCYIGTNTYYPSTNLETAFDPYVGGSPMIPAARIVAGATSASGIFYYSSGQYIGFVMLSTDTCPSIAGANLQSQSIFGADVYCRINFPVI